MQINLEQMEALLFLAPAFLFLIVVLLFYNPNH